MEKVIIFGAANGGYNLYKNLTNVRTIAFSDNDSSKWGKLIDDIPIVAPEQIKNLDYDYIFIGSIYGNQIKNQLINEIGVEKEIIYDQYHGEIFDGRVGALKACAEEIYRKGIAGNVAELGVFRGDFSFHINKYFYDRNIYLFDTFTGFEETDIIKEKAVLKEEMNELGVANNPFANTSIDSVLDRMENKDKCIIKQGYFPDSLNGLEDTFCFVSIDADLYLPILEGLTYFYPRLEDGGYIFIHDFDGFLYPGAKKAVREYCDKYNITIIHLNDRGGTVVIIKQIVNISGSETC